MPQYFTVQVNTSDLKNKVSRLKDNMKPVQFERAMYGIYQRTGRHVSSILRKDLPQQYEVRPNEISAAVKNPRLSIGAGGVGCSIPIQGMRGKLGSQYKATGGAHGWNNIKYKRRYKVKVKMLKGKDSTLPEKWHSDYPPFRNLGSKLGNLTYARSSKKRGPILKLTGIAIPQMPLNRSEADVQHDIKVFLEKQMDERFNALMRIGK